MLTWLKSAVAKVGSFVAGLFTEEGKKKAEEALGKVASLSEIALPICSVVAAMTPNKTDDEVIAVVKTYLGVAAVPAGSAPLTDQQKGDLLWDSAISAFKKAVSNKTGLTDSILDAALQIAYTAMRAATR